MRLLLVEDDLDIGAALENELKRRYIVDWSVTAQSALYNARVNMYDLVILDIGLPDGSGIDICSTLRTEKIITPILMLTAHTSMDDIVISLDSGADDFLKKPFKYAELEARLRALHRRSPQVSSSVLTYKDVVLNPLHRAVTREDKAIYLRRKQFDLLEYFMLHPKQVLTRGMIMEHIWESSADPLSNVVDVHMKYLRDCLDKPFSTRLLHTVSGIGYKLD
jgi:two-component system copper resistance phosphate regulon response regulator CusR